MPRLQIEFVHTPRWWSWLSEASASNFCFFAVPASARRGRRPFGVAKPIVSCPLFARLALLTAVRNSAQLTESRSPCICHRQWSSLFPLSTPFSFGHASNPNKSDIYLAGSRQYIPDLRPGLCCAQAYDSYG